MDTNNKNEALRNLSEESAEQLSKADLAQIRLLGSSVYDHIIGRRYISRNESMAEGKALRSQLPRSRQGQWTVKKNRTEAVDLIFEEEKGRIQELIPIRHKRMAESAFAFYRACAAVMANDLSRLPVTGIAVQTCGDAHISNFGLFQSPERNLVFDINDFDETLPGPWEWDLKRLLTSVEICGRERGFTQEQRTSSVLFCARTYRRSMRRFSEQGNLEVWYDHLDANRLYEENKKAMGQDEAAEIHRAIQKAFSKNNDKAVSKLTETTGDGEIRIVNNPPLVVPLDSTNREHMEKGIQWLKRARVEYRMSLPRERRSLIDQYEIVDIARKVVGVGSVGTKDWIMLLQGRENGDYLILQIKEAGASCLEKYVGKSHFLEHGRRVVEGQRAIQTAGDILLGWSRIQNEDGRIEDYYVRQMWDGKGSVDLEHITPEGLTGTAGLCAWTLAHAHAKTGDRHKIAAYLGKGEVYDKAMLEFAESYADQNEADYEVFLKRI